MLKEKKTQVKLFWAFCDGKRNDLIFTFAPFSFIKPVPLIVRTKVLLIKSLKV